MSLATIRRLAADILNCGESRIRIIDAKKADEALTRDDVRELIKQRAIVRLASQGVGRGKARFKQERKEGGRRRGRGSKHGTPSAAMPAKERWMRQVRSQRQLLKNLKPKLGERTYKTAYSMIKGNAFKDKKRLVTYLKESGALK